MVQDNDLVTDRLDFRQDVGAQDHRVLLGQIVDQAAHLDDLIQPACNDTLLFEPNSAVLAADGGFVCLGNDFAVFSLSILR